MTRRANAREGIIPYCIGQQACSDEREAALLW